jgi:uncharacterized protein (UPF0276 family)
MISTGLGLRSEHIHEIIANQPKVSFFEAISENYMGFGDGFGNVGLQLLERVRSNYPIVLHGVSLNIGSVDALNPNYLKKLKQLVQVIEPEWVSDHICWTGVRSENLHDLLPLPYTIEAIEHLVTRINLVQDVLQRPIVLENVSSYVKFGHSEMTEWEFISELVARSGCEILLDVNNVYVSAVNHGFNAHDFLNGIPVASVRQMHLAGHSSGPHGLIDTHDGPVIEAVWELYRAAVSRFGQVPTLIEWDAKIPPLAVLLAEAERAQEIWSIASDF